MNREIIYKAKRIVDGKFIEGYYNYDLYLNSHAITIFTDIGCEEYTIDPSTLEIKTESGEFAPLSEVRIVHDKK